LQAGAHRTVEDEHFLLKGVEVAAVGVGSGHAISPEFNSS
jgi:hypothetical protein